MPKIIVECVDPNDLNEIEKAIEQIAGKCNVTYFKQHEAMIEAGVSRSKSESARKIGEETGETTESVRHRIRAGEKKVGEVSQTAVTDESNNEINDNQVVSHGGKREGAGPKGKYEKEDKREDAVNIAGYEDHVYEVTDAMQIAIMAITQLERIREDDPKRLDAFNKVINWIKNHK